MKKVAIVTSTYNTAQDTNAFLTSFQRVVAPHFRLLLVVVDNGSKEPYTLPENSNQDSITLIRVEVNKGFVGGFNTGIKEAMRKGAEYIMIVNDDTILDQDIVTNLITVLDSRPEIGVTVPKIYFAKGREFHKDRYKKNELGKVLWYAGGYVDWKHAATVHRGVDEVDSGQYDKIEGVDFATGCCMMFKREVLEKVGFFDENYFLYYEDADLNERIKKAGYKIYYVPNAILTHVNASSSGGVGNVIQDYYISRNQMLYGLTYAPFRTKIALIRQSLRLLLHGRKFQKKGIRDFYLRRLQKGTF